MSKKASQSSLSQPSSTYTVTEAPIHAGRKIRVVCIGSGASGLLLAYKIRYNFEANDVELQVYEKNLDLGGTWLENRFVGATLEKMLHY